MRAMATGSATLHLASPPRQGIAARLRRIGSSLFPRPRAGWLARLLPRRRLQPADAALLLADSDAPFTPETVPGLRPEICAILNTPLEDCDPEILRLLLAALAQSIADAMPPEAGMTDAGSVFSTLWSRLAPALDDIGLDGPPAIAPDWPVYPSCPVPPEASENDSALSPSASPAPPAPVTRLPIVPVIWPKPCTDPTSPVLAESLRDLPLAPPAPQPAARTSEAPPEIPLDQSSRRSAPTSAAIPGETSAQHAAEAPGPTLPRDRPVFRRALSFLIRNKSSHPRAHWPLRRCRPRFPSCFLQLPAPRHCCYAARASP